MDLLRYDSQLQRSCWGGGGEGRGGRAQAWKKSLTGTQISFTQNTFLLILINDLPHPHRGVSMAQALQAAQLQRVMKGDTQYPKPLDFHPSYGTAGFRSVADRLPSTVYR